MGSILRLRLHHPPRDAGPLLVDLVDGYTAFCDFNTGELAPVPALRVLRQVHDAGWAAERWGDPAFPRAFPWAAEARWWAQHVADSHAALEE